MLTAGDWLSLLPGQGKLGQHHVFFGAVGADGRGETGRESPLEELIASGPQRLPAQVRHLDAPRPQADQHLDGALALEPAPVRRTLSNDSVRGHLVVEAVSSHLENQLRTGNPATCLLQ